MRGLLIACSRPWRHAKPTMGAGIIAMALLTLTPAVAETKAVELSRQERARMRDYVVKQKILPAAVEGEVTVGTVLPSIVLLRPPPADWSEKVTKYQYVYHDNRILLVDPATRKVVQIVN